MTTGERVMNEVRVEANEKMDGRKKERRLGIKIPMERRNLEGLNLWFRDWVI